MSTITIPNLPAAGALTGTEVLPIVQSNVTSKTTVQDIANLAVSGLAGTNFVYVAADGTDTANATALQAAYTTAQGMSPSATNRITILAAPGYYNFGSTTFTMSTQYIDLVSLDGNKSVIFNSSNSAGTISITASDVFVKGIDVGTKQFRVASSLSLLKVENCKGGLGSFGYRGTINGTFTNCTGGGSSFAGGGFISPPAGVTDNGSTAIASGTFINCTAGDSSFGLDTPGSGLGQASGIFVNCTGVTEAFGSSGTASGTFTECVGGFVPFGAGGTASGTFFRCIGGTGAFGGYGGTFSGTATSCQGDTNSFGGVSMFGTGGTLTGKLYYCRLATGTASTGRGNFNTVSGAGVTRLCLTSTNVEDNQG